MQVTTTAGGHTVRKRSYSMSDAAPAPNARRRAEERVPPALAVHGPARTLGSGLSVTLRPQGEPNAGAVPAPLAAGRRMDPALSGVTVHHADQGASTANAANADICRRYACGKVSARDVRRVTTALLRQMGGDVDSAFACVKLMRTVHLGTSQQKVTLDDFVACALVGVCAAAGRPSLAERVPRMLREDGVEPNAFVDAALFKAGAAMVHPKEANVLACRSYLEGKVSADKVQAMTSAVMECIDVEDAWTCIQRMRGFDPGMRIDPPVPLSAQTATAFVTLCAAKGKAARAQAVLEAMQEDGEQPDAILYSALASAWAKSGKPEFGFAQICRQYRRTPWMKDMDEAVRRVVSTCLPRLKPDAAWECVRIMQEELQPPVGIDTFVLTGLVKSCREAGESERAMSVLPLLDACPASHHPDFWNELIRAWAVQGNVDQAWACLKRVPPHVVLDGYTHSAITLAYLNAGRLDEVEAAWRTLAESGRGAPRYHIPTFNLIISELANSERPGQAIVWLEKLRATHGLAPNVASFTAAIEACERGGRLGLAKELFEELKRSPYARPNALSYCAIVSACVNHGDMHAAIGYLREAASERVGVMKPLLGLQHGLIDFHARSLFFAAPGLDLTGGVSVPMAEALFELHWEDGHVLGNRLITGQGDRRVMNAIEGRIKAHRLLVGRESGDNGSLWAERP